MFTFQTYSHYFRDPTFSSYCKVQLFWEGHTNLRNLPYGFDVYYEKIAQIFVAISEKLNFSNISNVHD